MKKPKPFIRVIAAFSLLKPHQLGWDPTMKIYQGPDNPAIPSYLRKFDTAKIRKDPHSLCRVNWVIAMPDEEPPTNATATNTQRCINFVTVRALSTAGVQDICGRASLVWAAVKETEIQSSEKQVCHTSICQGSL